MIQFHVFKDSTKGADFVAQMMYECILSKPTGFLGLATGNTFIPVYQRVLELLNHHKNIYLSELSTCNLDDYIVGGYSIPDSDIRSFKYYMKQHFFGGLQKFGFCAEAALFPADVYPHSKQFSVGEYLREFDRILASLGGIDIQFVGIGPKESPHVAFCEPDFALHESEYDWLEYPSYVTEIDLATRLANRFNSGCEGRIDRVPKMAATMSTGTLYRLVKNTYVLVAFGESKSVATACLATPSDKIPASVIQMLDRRGVDCHVICDVAAAKGLDKCA